MKVRRSSGLLLVTLLLASCGRDRSEKNLKALEKLQSWIATVQFVSMAWRAGSVPKAYTADTLERAGEQVHETSGQFRQAPLPPRLQSQLPGHVERIENIIIRLAAAVKRSDKDAAAQETAARG